MKQPYLRIFKTRDAAVLHGKSFVASKRLRWHGLLEHPDGWAVVDGRTAIESEMPFEIIAAQKGG